MKKFSVQHVHTIGQLNKAVSFFVQTCWIAQDFYESGDIQALLRWMRISDRHVILSAKARKAVREGEWVFSS